MALSRQRKWQIEREKTGLCPSCALPKLYSTDRCFRHYVLRELLKYGVVLTKKSKPHFHGRRDQMIAEMRGRYMAIALGGEVPEPVDHYTPHKFLRQVKAVEKVAMLQKRLDKRALREYAARGVANENQV